MEMILNLFCTSANGWDVPNRGVRVDEFGFAQVNFNQLLSHLFFWMNHAFLHHRHNKFYMWKISKIQVGVMLLSTILGVCLK